MPVFFSLLLLQREGGSCLHFLARKTEGMVHVWYKVSPRTPPPALCLPFAAALGPLIISAGSTRV